MRSFLSLAALAALAPAALAKVYIYKPVEASHYQPGDSFTVSWRDDGTSPSWTSWGASSIGLYTGSATSQTLLATLGHVDDAATTPAMKITIDGGWGPDSDQQYFIRVQSDAGTDATTSDPLQAFSARFTLSGMTGTFSSAVQAQLAGSAVPAATTAAAAGASSSGMAKIASASSPAVKVASTAAASSSVAASKASGASASSPAAASASASGNSTTSAAGMERGVASGAVALAAVALAALA
ncbi:hypothetical protein JCM8097_003155 [Rhodosporidiobolus ruineniae]